MSRGQPRTFFHCHPEALLIFPDRLIAVEQLDPEVVHSIRDRTGEEER